MGFFSKGFEDNQDFQNEIKAVNGEVTVPVLKAPANDIERDQAQVVVDDKDIFPEETMTGEVPELKNDFIILKSKEDRIIEAGQIAQEMYSTRLVSRSKIIAFESIAREVLVKKDSEGNPVDSEEADVVVSDHEVNMFTEDPSAVELDTAITGSQAAIDRMVGDARNSALEVGKRLLEVIQSDRNARNECLTKGIAVFNRAVAKFLITMNSDNLESVNMKIKRSLNWGNLMAINLSTAKYGSDANLEQSYLEKMVKPFDGTAAETFVKEVGVFLDENVLASSVLYNFVHGEMKLVVGGDTFTSPPPTFGDLFKALGSDRFPQFYMFLNGVIEDQASNVKAILTDLNGQTDIQEIIKCSSLLSNVQQTTMNAASNMSVICHVQKMLINFLENY